jgi:hypothetical protein
VRPAALPRAGKLVAAQLEGFHGIDYLSCVVVSGTLAVDDAGNLRVVADGIHRSEHWGASGLVSQE